MNTLVAVWNGPVAQALNLLQVAAETLLFYHPAVWWISRRIRIERENCCDDLAMEVCADRACYAHALTRLEEIRGAQTPPAMAAAATGSRPGSLVTRIRRILGLPEPRMRTPRARLGAVLALLLAAVLTAILPLASETSPPDEKQSDATAASAPGSVDLRPIDLNPAKVTMQFTSPALEGEPPVGMFGVGHFPMGEFPSPRWVYEKRSKDELPDGHVQIVGCVTHHLYGVGLDGGAKLQVRSFSRVGSKIALRFKYVAPLPGAKYPGTSAYFSARLPDLPAGDYDVEAVFDDYWQDVDGKVVRAESPFPTIKPLACKITAPNREASADLKKLAQRAIALKPATGPTGKTDQNPTGLFSDEDAKSGFFTAGHPGSRIIQFGRLGEDGQVVDFLGSVLDVGPVDQKLRAVAEMEKAANPDSVPELLAAAKSNNYPVRGSENATVHYVYRVKLRTALEKITGLSLIPKGLRTFTTDPDGKQRELRSEDSPGHFREEIDFAKVQRWLRVVYLADGGPERDDAPGTGRPKPGEGAAVGADAVQQTLDRIRDVLPEGWSVERSGNTLAIQRDGPVKVQRIAPGMSARIPGEPDPTIREETYKIKHLFDHYDDVGFAWGKEQHGLQLGLKVVEGSRFQVPAFVHFVVVIKNNSLEERRPLKQHRVLRRPSSGELRGIELQAASTQKIEVVGSPDSDRRLGEMVELHEVTRVNIIPAGTDPTQGQMWIVHSNDALAGIQYVIHLRCTLRPEFFPAEE